MLVEDGRVVWYLVASKLVLVETHSKYLKKHLLAYLLACFEFGFRRMRATFKRVKLDSPRRKGCFFSISTCIPPEPLLEEVCG